ncbi:hypothetical protein [Flavobacterium sp. N3904]|uniref:hypothetical protein n=1 Tax=Flavobacterium sp. N3904 TaxID=2986835 RepID=UPI0022257940|nr:hypothetical protein [Flavobacterium sp. N3904]
MLFRTTFDAMKVVAQVLLFVFITFLITPTIVRLIEKDSDTSFFYSFSEEEHSLKGIKAIFDSHPLLELPQFFINNSSLILSENLSKHDIITASIFIPPPNRL